MKKHSEWTFGTPCRIQRVRNDTFQEKPPDEEKGLFSGCGLGESKAMIL
jgi:hypothetical protein